MRWEVPRSRLPLEDQIDELVARATEDWLQPADVFDVARFAGDTGEAAYVEQAIRLVTDLIRAELVVPGDVNHDGFHPWSATADEAVARIAAAWRSDHDAAPDSFVVWLEATPAGLRRGERALRVDHAMDD